MFFGRKNKAVGRLVIDNNPIPTLENINVIEYENNGLTKYKVAVVKNGYAKLLDSSVSQDQFLRETCSDSTYDIRNVREYLDCQTVIEYDLARSKNMSEFCRSTLHLLQENLNFEKAKENGLAYAMKK